MIRYFYFLIVILIFSCKKDNPDPISNEAFDIFHVRFGMSKAEVRANEEKRLGTVGDPGLGWSEPNRDEAWISKGTFINDGQTIIHYQFKDGKLVAASEAVVKPATAPDFGISPTLMSSLIDISQRLGFNGIYALETLGHFGDTTAADVKLRVPLAWTKDNLAISLGVETFAAKSGGTLTTHALTFRER